jgi:hypothetical protein
MRWTRGEEKNSTTGLAQQVSRLTLKFWTLTRRTCYTRWVFNDFACTAVFVWSGVHILFALSFGLRCSVTVCCTCKPVIAELISLGLLMLHWISHTLTYFSLCFRNYSPNRRVGIFLINVVDLWSLVYWDVAPCSHVEGDRSFRSAYCLHHQGDPSVALMMEAVRTLKRRFTSAWLYGATSQKTLNFILAAVRTWNLTL